LGKPDRISLRNASKIYKKSLQLAILQRRSQALIFIRVHFERGTKTLPEAKNLLAKVAI